MDYNLKDSDQAKDAIKYLHQLHMEGHNISINIKYRPISDPQLNLITVLQKLYACERGERLDDVRGDMEADFFNNQPVVTADGHKVMIAQEVKSLTRPAAQQYIEWIYIWCAKRECKLPSSEELNANKHKYNKIISENRAYL